MGALAQVILVLVGHFAPTVADEGYALGGLLIAILAGLIYARRTGGHDHPLVGGGSAGAISALAGVLLAAVLGEAPWVMLLVGGVAGFVGGVAGGSLGVLLARPHGAP